MAEQARIVETDHVFRISFWQNVLVVDVANDIDEAHMQRLGRAHHDLHAQYPRGIATLAIIRAGVPVASTQARDESARFIKALGNAMRRTVVVIEDRGVLALMLQTVVRGLNVVTRNPKLVIAPSLPEAFAAITPSVDDLPLAQVPRALAEAVTSFRADYAPASQAAAGA